LVLLTSCQSPKVNPSFDVTTEEASNILEQMAANPVAAKRPVVVIGGYLDPGIAPGIIAHRLGAYFTEVTVVPIIVGFQSTFDACRDTVIEAVEAATQEATHGATEGVDVIGASMGGLVARYAALEIEGRPGLETIRLFTIGTPHLGARVAELPSLNQLHLDMRKDSPFMAMIRDSESEIDYQIVPYTLLGDDIVGEENTAPSGQTPYWLDKGGSAFAHFEAMIDERIFADIVRRLRDEEPLSSEPPAPLPSGAPRCGG
jgi:hypothetical protein